MMGGLGVLDLLFLFMSLMSDLKSSSSWGSFVGPYLGTSRIGRECVYVKRISWFVVSFSDLGWVKSRYGDSGYAKMTSWLAVGVLGLWSWDEWNRNFWTLRGLIHTSSSHKNPICAYVSI